MTIRQFYFLILSLFWSAWLGLLAVAAWVVCEESLAPSWAEWLARRSLYAHGRCKACCEEIIRL